MSIKYDSSHEKSHEVEMEQLITLETQKYLMQANFLR